MRRFVWTRSKAVGRLSHDGRQGNNILDQPRQLSSLWHKIHFALSWFRQRMMELAFQASAAKNNSVTTMAFKFYRGDSRTPDEIKKAGGFQAWVPLTAEQARLLVRKANREAISNDQFPDALASSLKAVTIQKTLDLQVFIKFTKNKSTTPQVSTAPDEDCGGQANGKDSKGRPFVIYRMEFGALNVLQTGGARPARQDDFPHNSPFPKVLIDAASLDAAETIAILMKDEIAFLTSIPLTSIKGYKQQGSAWAAM